MNIGVNVRRLENGDTELARRLFALMSDVFEEAHQPLSDRYIARLLARHEFWALAALDGSSIIGGLTAHTLPMTRSESREIFVYDIAVLPAYRRRGAGRSLFMSLRRAAAAAGIGELFVPADDEDLHALDFYRALGGSPTNVTIFTFAARPVPAS